MDYLCSVNTEQEKETHLKNLISALPDNPGVYRFSNVEGIIIYVGKARNLKKRVSSYFNRDQYENRKTELMVRKITDIRYTVVDTELDALLLENNLIKKYQPRYNIRLKDDKSYPWICIRNERFPRVYSMRNPVKDGSQYFGPYANVKTMYTLLDLAARLYPLRNCNLNLSKENISAKKFKVCLEYQIGNCLGPCEALQSEENYMNSITQIKHIIKGNIRAVLEHLQKQMNDFSAKLEFEKAQEAKEKYELVERYRWKSTVVNSVTGMLDVFSIISDDTNGYVNFMRVVDGAIVQTHTLELNKRLDESDEELLAFAMGEIFELFGNEMKEVIVPFLPGIEFPGIEFIIPQRGDKKSLLELSLRNAKYFRQDKLRIQEKINPERHTQRILEQMKKDLRMKELPAHIECFDNSNIQGAHPVAAMVVFKNAKPSKKDYRHFNIRTVEGPDDFASMEEVITRRYKHVLEENQPLPQLIIIDGGKGQLSSAVESLDKLGLRGKITIIGIAKKLEEIYFPGDSLPLYIDKKSETLKVIQHARNEAHRFGITHHRKRRSKATVKTELTEIKGISDITAKKLLKAFGSVKKLKEASEEEISKVIGKAKGKLVAEHFHLR